MPAALGQGQHPRQDFDKNEVCVTVSACIIRANCYGMRSRNVFSNLDWQLLPSTNLHGRVLCAMARYLRLRANTCQVGSDSAPLLAF